MIQAAAVVDGDGGTTWEWNKSTLQRLASHDRNFLACGSVNDFCVDSRCVFFHRSVKSIIRQSYTIDGESIAIRIPRIDVVAIIGHISIIVVRRDEVSGKRSHSVCRGRIRRLKLVGTARFVVMLPNGS